MTIPGLKRCRANAALPDDEVADPGLKSMAPEASEIDIKIRLLLLSYWIFVTHNYINLIFTTN